MDARGCGERHRTAARAAGYVGASVVAVWIAATMPTACTDAPDCFDEQDPPVGPFDDAPHPVLCRSDALDLSPTSIAFGGATPAPAPTQPSTGDDGGAQGTVDDGGASAAEAGAPSGATDAGLASSGPASEAGATPNSVGPNSVQMAIVGRRDTGQPHEAAHVDVKAEVEVVTLAPTTDSTLSGGCRKISDYYLQCVLDSTGVATFTVNAAGRNGNDVISATSGPLQRLASVTVGPAGLEGVKFLPDPSATPSSIVGLPSPMACGTPAPLVVSCSNRTSRAISLESIVPVAIREGDAGAVTNPPLTPSGPVSARVTVVPNTGAPEAAWLSTSPLCRDQLSSTSVTFDGTGPLSSSTYLCSDGSQAVVTLAATFPSRVGTGTGFVSTDVALPPVAATLSAVAFDAGTPSPTGDGGSGDAGSTLATAGLVARDCRGTPIAGATVSIGTASGVTDSNGLATVAYAPADGGTTVASASVASANVQGQASTCTSIVLGGNGQ